MRKFKGTNTCASHCMSWQIINMRFVHFLSFYAPIPSPLHCPTLLSNETNSKTLPITQIAQLLLDMSKMHEGRAALDIITVLDVFFFLSVSVLGVIIYSLTRSEEQRISHDSLFEMINRISSTYTSSKVTE